MEVPKSSRGDNKDSRHPSQAQGTSWANSMCWGLGGGHKADRGQVLLYRNMSKQANRPKHQRSCVALQREGGKSLCFVFVSISTICSITSN